MGVEQLTARDPQTPVGREAIGHAAREAFGETGARRCRAKANRWKITHPRTSVSALNSPVQVRVGVADALKHLSVGRLAIGLVTVELSGCERGSCGRGAVYELPCGTYATPHELHVVRGRCVCPGLPRRLPRSKWPAIPVASKRVGDAAKVTKCGECPYRGRGVKSPPYIYYLLLSPNKNDLLLGSLGRALRSQQGVRQPPAKVTLAGGWFPWQKQAIPLSKPIYESAIGGNGRCFPSPA